MNSKLCFLLRPYHSRENIYVYLISQFLCFFMIFTFLLFFPHMLKATWEPKASLWFGRTQLHWTWLEKKINFKKKVSSGSSQTVWYVLLLDLYCLVKTASLNILNVVSKFLELYESLYAIWLCSNVPESQRRSLISVYCNHITFHIFILT